MKGLILKDIYSLKKYGKTMLLLAVFYSFMIFMMGNAEVFLGTVVIMFAVASITSFAYDNQAGWDTYVSTLPVSRKNVVMSKYALSYLLALLGGLLALLVGWVNGILKGTGNFIEMLVSAYAMFAIAVVFVSVLLPLIYKFGVERSRIIIIAAVAIPVAAVMALAQSKAIPMPDEQTIKQALLLSPLIVAACCVLSYTISHAIYRKKEV